MGEFLKIFHSYTCFIDISKKLVSISVEFGFLWQKFKRYVASIQCPHQFAKLR